MSDSQNKLSLETSPYLLQHAGNPVGWLAWNEKSLEKAKSENKLLIVSIGYSACHWCHVMAHESFEDESVAETMNENFVNIKVDREERPDVDQVYMNALQLMTRQGGWPLNIVALPDGSPVWGCTYLPKENWRETLLQLANLYETDPKKMRDYAGKLKEGMTEMQVLAVSQKNKQAFPKDFFRGILDKWEKQFDWEMGGTGQAPKFPMPSNLRFLMRYGIQSHPGPHPHPGPPQRGGGFSSQENSSIKLMGFVQLSLEKMAFGGIYDQVGGGFSRYSTDGNWHIPHFEKMLYDNAQLVSLYCDAFLVFKNPLYQKTVEETLGFIKRELMDENGGFYSALDADSKNENGVSEEGAFYAWAKEELKHILGKDFELFSAYFNIDEYGYWERNRYVLIRNKPTKTIAEDFPMAQNEVEEVVERCKQKLFKVRGKRNRPGLDDKIITSWNALAIIAFLDAYRVFNNEDYLKTALKSANFLCENLFGENGGLQHVFKKEKDSTNGYLEDYAFMIEAFLNLYENTFDEGWLQKASDLAKVSFRDFFDEEIGLFYFTSKQDGPLPTRTIELQDNVIPASNSVMAKNLFKLSRYFGDVEYNEISKKMLSEILPQIKEYPQAHSNWLDLALDFEMGFFEVAITGEDCFEKAKELNSHYIPNKLLAGSISESKMPLLENRFKKDKTLIYVCRDNSCQAPVEGVDEALEQMKTNNFSF